MSGHESVINGMFCFCTTTHIVNSQYYVSFTHKKNEIGIICVIKWRHKEFLLRYMPINKFKKLFFLGKCSRNTLIHLSR